MASGIFKAAHFPLHEAAQRQISEAHADDIRRRKGMNADQAENDKKPLLGSTKTLTDNFEFLTYN